MQPAHAGDEQDGGERRAVDERGAEVGLEEDEQRSGTTARAITVRTVRSWPRDARRSTRKPASASTNSAFPNSDGWNWNGPTSIQRFEPRIASAKT